MSVTTSHSANRAEEIFRHISRWLGAIASLLTILTILGGWIAWQQAKAREVRLAEINAALAPVRGEIKPLQVLPAQVHSLRTQLAEDHRRLVGLIVAGQAATIKPLRRIEKRVEKKR